MGREGRRAAPNGQRQRVGDGLAPSPLSAGDALELVGELGRGLVLGKPRGGLTHGLALVGVLEK